MSVLAVVVFYGLLGVTALQAQEATSPVLDFEGNKVFSTHELREVANKCLGDNARSEETLAYCVHMVRNFMSARGYLQAQLGAPRQEQTEEGLRTVVSVKEGALFRLGEVRITGTRILSPSQIREMLGSKTGDIADGDSIGVWLYERVKKAYGNLGYIQYTAEVQPRFHRKADAREGVADLDVNIEEGSAFTIASIQFDGNENVPRDVLLREMTLRKGEIFSQELLDSSLTRINQREQFETIDPDRDVDYTVDQETPEISLTIHLKKKVTGWAPLPVRIGRAISIQPH
jgi:outer membrane protein assembly factor BamA